MPPCRKIAVTMRHCSPVAMPTTSPFGSCARPTDAPSRTRCDRVRPAHQRSGAARRPPRAAYPMPMSASSTLVTEMALAFATATRRPGPCRYSLRASATHVGHWCPTGAAIMHSVQIGAPAPGAVHAGGRPRGGGSSGRPRVGAAGSPAAVPCRPCYGHRCLEDVIVGGDPQERSASSEARTSSRSNSGPQRSTITPSASIRNIQGSVRSPSRKSQSAAAWFTVLSS